MYKKLNSFKKPIAVIKIYPEKNSRTSLVVQGMGGPPANTGDTGLITGPGRVHMPQSNSAHESAHNYWACVLLLLKPVCLETVLPRREASIMRSLTPQWRAALTPLTATRESWYSQRKKASNKHPAQPKLNK